MAWDTPPHPTGPGSIAMTAATALDRAGVEYYFTCVSGAGHDSGWRNSPAYEDTGLSPNKQYTYTAKARDKSHNQNSTLASPVASAVTFMAGDFEPDGDVDYADYARFSRQWPMTKQAGPAVKEADLDGDGDIDLADLSVLADNWLAGQL